MNRFITPAGLAALVVLAFVLTACGGPAGSPPQGDSSRATPALNATAVVFRSPTCSCCQEHEEYLRTGALEVDSVVDPDVGRIKQAYGVPPEMYSCHTADIEGYFVEGHVPLAAIEQLLAERPELDGIALPGMPPGSPGMGGPKQGPLTVFGIRDGEVVGVFGEY